jgi:proteasome lid subunit RPN8/RPN11
MPKAIRPRAWLSERAADNIRRAAADAHPRETGGVLIGVYTGRRRPWILEAPVVESGRVGRTYYEIPAGIRPRVVDEARAGDERVGYLGEWHSHPADVGPSALDSETVQRIASDPAAACPHPVLIVARRREREYDLDARQLAHVRLRKLRLIAAGGLPSANGRGPE